MTITFVGHSTVSSKIMLKDLVKEQLRISISNSDSVTFYLGGYGDFDEICSYACRELKEENRNIEMVYVTPYLNLSEQKKIEEMKRCGLCDSSIYPPVESTPPKFAISKRNEWMVTNSDLIIAYVNHSYGGAYKSLQNAKRKRKKIINIADFLN